ncbi:MAG: putative toxin-antitoxin system toxin component, PIN family [Desulfotomaculaceae bacterium]|nr:putative toxin-antitoxin system toxin component, PIN family [Desulfotomaculaceae bacterium]
MKIVVDTNVVISGLLVPSGPPGKVVDLWVENKFAVIVCRALIEEYFNVLLRPKFKKAGTIIERQELLTGLLELENSIFVYPKTSFDVIRDDPDDNRILECAVEGEAQYIISGDEHLLALKEFQGIPIVLPAEFLSFGIFIPK